MKKSIIAFSITLIILVTILLTFGNQDEEKNEIAVKEVKAKIESGENILLLDVRTENEFSGSLGHLNEAILIPLAELQSRLEEMEEHQEKEIIVYCRSGNRSRRGTAILRDEGLNAVNMTGGMLAWNRMMNLIKKNSNKVENETVIQ